MDPIESSATKQNRPFAGTTLRLISFVPLLGAGLFGVILPCKDDFSSYCESNEPFLWIAAGAVLTILGMILVRRKFFPESVAKEKEKKEAAKERKREHYRIAAEQAKAVADGVLVDPQKGGWKSVPKVVCPHCQEVGKVKNFIPPEVGDLFEAALAKRFSMGGETQAQRAIRIQEANKKGEIPNMRCSNCTVEWRG